MIAFNIEQQENVIKIDLTGDATINHAREIYKKLDELFMYKKNILIDTRGVEKADLAFIQLIAAACQAQEQLGRELQLHENCSEAVKRLINITGFEYAHFPGEVDSEPGDEPPPDVSLTTGGNADE